MGRILTETNKVKFEIENKKDCILYLGHIIEYVVKKHDIYWRLCLEPLRYLAHELAVKRDITLNGDADVLEFIREQADDNFEFDLDFYRYKLFNSAVNLIKNEIINVIGDYSVDKLAVSYNNYLDIVKKNNIEGVRHKSSKEKRELIAFFNTKRNFLYHFTSDKLCEWISYREEQAKNYEDVNFEFGTDFNIYVSETVPFNLFVEEINTNIVFKKKIKDAIAFMKSDFEDLIGDKVTLNIKKGYLDNSPKDITYNGFESHELSKKKKISDLLYTKTPLFC
ncbi:hypothetical protein PASE110613_15010 [Paenibacillus sediminis]|uniref:Uncharacterized protein n=1 Tax=Paenibacillus sediminis TaxID=664909 RepID=A0ABS4H663_9BACL|nr:hypothetical protein [Paenibacillus sediminis]MBP1937976.1 hypothetical protein [Paenibacillus sediminis]